MALQEFQLPQRGGQQVRNTAVNKVLDKIAPSEATRSRKLGEDYLKDYYGMGLNSVNKMFHIDDEGNLNLMTDPETGLVAAQPFPSIAEAYQDYQTRSQEKGVEPNLGQFQEMYTTTKKIYDDMLTNKLYAAMNRGFDMEDIQDALHQDENFAIANYINDNGMQVEGLAPFTAQASLKESGMWDYIKRLGPAAGAGFATKIATKKFGTLGFGAKVTDDVYKSRLGKWGFKLLGDGQGITTTGKTAGKGLVGRFLNTVTSQLGPKAAMKISMKLASIPVKAAIPYLGWAWLAYDIYDLVGGDDNLFKMIKASWDGEAKNYNSNF